MWVLNITCELQPWDFVSRSTTAGVTEPPRLSPAPGEPLRVRAGVLRPPPHPLQSVDRARRESAAAVCPGAAAGPSAEVVFSVPDSSNAMALGSP